MQNPDSAIGLANSRSKSSATRWKSCIAKPAVRRKSAMISSCELHRAGPAGRFSSSQESNAILTASCRNSRPDLDPQEAERLLRELQCGRPLENDGGAK